MHSKIIATALFTMIAMVPQISAHSVVLKAVGDASTTAGLALGFDETVPRDGTRRNPFQQDSTIFKQGNQAQRNVAAAKGCGRTLKAGENSIANFDGPIAQVKEGGQLTMTVHQINADGAGPYTCMVDTTATGESFTAMQVVTDVPGKNGRDRTGQKTDFPLVVQMAAGTQCTGKVGATENVCMVRCQNPARAGPFGGCVPVQMVGAAGAGGTTNGTLATRDIEGVAGRRFRRSTRWRA